FEKQSGRNRKNQIRKTSVKNRKNQIRKTVGKKQKKKKQKENKKFALGREPVGGSRLACLAFR
ncbi:MAG: hypothetical protein V1728_00200, partial [Candidatus Micrarchaeota archaeon]